MSMELSNENASSVPVAVIMERITLDNRWASEKWEAKGVVHDDAPAGTGERVIVKQDGLTQMLFPGFVIRLKPEEADSYHMNITSSQPRVFVLWRMHDDVARPEMITVDYYEGTRWADCEENVDSVALPGELLPWMAEFVRQHYKPEPPKPRRYASSRDKGRMGNF